jgi:Nif-specific regulatory protein/two-component system response regulator HydG
MAAPARSSRRAAATSSAHLSSGVDGPPLPGGTPFCDARGVPRDSELLEVARLILLSEEDDPGLIERLFRRIMLSAGAHRGFLVVREDGHFVERFELNFSRGAVSAAERRFSHTLLRQALLARQVLYTADLHDDRRTSGQTSLVALAPASVIVAPLTAGDEVYGGLYLERPVHLGLDDDVRQLVDESARMAGQLLRRLLDRQALLERNASLERDLFARHDFEGIVTRDPKLLEVLETVAQVADAAAPVLVRGETGTGKELIARALHVNSERRARPFAALHCGALSATVLESELFGHVKGAFTGADRDRPGRIASAHGSTLFLDEIAEIPPEIQAKLLRCLQFGEIMRVGSDRVEKVSVRVVAATNQDLAALIAAGKFRRDLYYRLNAIELGLPPLRARRGDVPLLCAHFLRRHWQRKGTPRLAPPVERALASYAFPGNVRELEHLIERACLVARSAELDLPLFPTLGGGAEAAGGDDFTRLTGQELERLRGEAVAGLERRFVGELLRAHDGNVSRAARAAEMQRSYLQKLIARHRGR